MKALKGIIDKIEHHKHPSVDSPPDTTVKRRLDERDVYRYRRQRGVNLGQQHHHIAKDLTHISFQFRNLYFKGSWFVLEKWISSTPFQNASPPASSDYDVACGHDARQVLERHWDSWITEEDWKWISARGINSVRLPIGYYHLYAKDPSVVQGTPFFNMGHIFQGAWPRIINAIDKAASYGIGVLIDLHSAPGKQNADAHSGISNHPVEFYKKSNLTRTTHVLILLTSELKNLSNVVGIQLVNEPQNHGSLAGWYNSTINAIRSAVGPDVDLPLYVHDAWNTSQYASLVHSRPNSDFVVLDHHLYRCFTPHDQSLSGDQHASSLPRDEFMRYADATRGNFVVAEFSAALNPRSMGNSNAGEQDRQRRVFARGEIEMFERSCGGWWWWTYKKEGGWDAGWCIRDAVRAEIMPSWMGMRKGRCGNDVKQRNALASDALEQHSRYWEVHKGTYEHWRFEVGFKQGWDDAFMFFCFSPGAPDVEKPASELGFAVQWLKRRAVEHVLDYGEGKHVWEFGARAFYIDKWVDEAFSRTRARIPPRLRGSDNNVQGCVELENATKDRLPYKHRQMFV